MNLFLGGLAVYALFAGGLYLLQDKLIFPRHATMPPRHALPEGTERLVLHSVEGHELVGRLLRARGRSKGLVIGFSGNAWNADDCFTFVARRLQNVDVAVFHYRGYPPSEGEPSEQALFADALTIHDHLQEEIGPVRIFAVGFSLGSGVAVYLAAKRDVAGLVLVTPFDSIEEIARARYRILPVRALLKHPFRSILHLDGVNTPTAVIAASDDRVVPRARTQALVDGLHDLVMFETVPDSTHGGIYDLAAIDEMLRRAFEAVAGRTIDYETKPPDPMRDDPP
ncbi:MAG: alpha/beta fold hydrolase [Geminicoccaceae bacterium]|nr:alpha/beta fold hydrolase [Geminicoccaceae bacterium]